MATKTIFLCKYNVYFLFVLFADDGLHGLCALKLPEFSGLVQTHVSHINVDLVPSPGKGQVVWLAERLKKDVYTMQATFEQRQWYMYAVNLFNRLSRPYLEETAWILIRRQYLYTFEKRYLQSTIDISKLWGLFSTSSNYPKCTLICTSGNLDL